MADHLLNIETQTRPTISIDGTSYEILTPDDLSIVDHHRFQKWGKRIDTLMAAPELDDDAAVELTSMLAKLTDRIMCDVPEDVRAKLTDTQRLRVAEVFTQPLRRKPKKRAVGKPKAASRSRGPRSSRDSKGSTAATPPDG